MRIMGALSIDKIYKNVVEFAGKVKVNVLILLRYVKRMENEENKRAERPLKKN